jgi:hypothetical protein
VRTHTNKLLAVSEVHLQYYVVKNWFEDDFFDLDPLLQKLHISGGELSGNIKISYGKGIAGLIGKRLAKKMKLPNQGEHKLLVSISHSSQGLHWNRKFNDNNIVKSLFVPFGNNKSGYWIETTGPVQMKLTVDIVNGGWFWRCLKVSLFGLPIPLCLIPKSKAYKIIENGKYIFNVSFTYPLLGSLVSYKGILDAKYNE